ncbi:TetR/AcrR family transcriptional regulator [Sphingobacterium multivorum]|uniref:TetR/AcrR family transcriptional regulator n=1 Tax=Sphingobacterium multivorum TaxID=28454 RepID=UPI00195F55D1|nr:TetR/AcrR family transcriptional regulator [Sphingobacterium multivorum]QRQ61894.1 TetR/AcrR family transcriptional regulator [Sphingobacterium multivorum]
MNKKEQVKERIGQAAMECFERYGLEKTTLEDIAKTVGLNKTSLYYYYKNKEDIFIEVAIREGQSFIDTLQKSTLKKKGVENQISFYLESRLNYYTNVLNMNRVSVKSLDKILPRFFELYDAMMVQEKAFLTKLLTQAIAHEKLDLTDPENIASVLINFANALKHSTEQQAILKRQVEIDYAQSLRDTKFLVGLIFRGLRI